MMDKWEEDFYKTLREILNTPFSTHIKHKIELNPFKEQ
jgi:hypothetical protein